MSIDNLVNVDGDVVARGLTEAERAVWRRDVIELILKHNIPISHDSTDDRIVIVVPRNVDIGQARRKKK